MATKQQEMNELSAIIWKIANDLRGAVDGWDFKMYVLGTLFYKYISERTEYEINKNEHEAGLKDFNYADLDDESSGVIKDAMIDKLGYFIKPSQLFCNMVKEARWNENLNVELANVFKEIEASTKGTSGEKAFNGLFDDFDMNSNKLGGTVAERNKRLASLLESMSGCNFKYSGNTTDTIGNAYETLCGYYAKNAGKSGGEYYTPQEVSELIARLSINGRTEINKVYDPTCGSGSLLLKAAQILPPNSIKQGFFGQEINITTKNLATINMFLHGVEYDMFDIALGDTLTEPKHWNDEPFDMIVSNPPYSVKWEGDASPKLKADDRFSPAGVLAPKSKADLAFIMHCLAWLAEGGTASIVCFPGVMYRGGAEQKIRKYLIDNNFIDTIIQLPDKLFYGTSIATCIMVLKKGKTDNNVLFIDASNEFVKITNSNMLSSDNIEHVMEWFTDRKDVEYKAKLVSNNEIEKEKYNLSVSTYVEKEDTREKVDIDALNKELEEIVAREAELREKIATIIKDLEGK